MLPVAPHSVKCSRRGAALALALGLCMGLQIWPETGRDSANPSIHQNIFSWKIRKINETNTTTFGNNCTSSDCNLAVYKFVSP